MSCFKLPESLCRELGSMISRFWWGQKNEERKIPWIAWDKLCKSKAEGGMGFRDLKAFNLALLAKQGWRLMQNQNSLFHQVFKAKYFANDTFLDAQLGKRPSFAWRSIMAAKDVILEGTRWNIGNGAKVRVWEDKWMPTPSSYKVVSPCMTLSNGDYVSCLIDQELHAWKADVVHRTFLPHEAQVILGIALSSLPTEDRIVWAVTPNGAFSIRSAYHVAKKLLDNQAEGQCSDNSAMKALWKLIWGLKCPSKIRNFAWRACKNILPTKTRLRDRHIPIEVDCDLCEEVETIGHVFWKCNLANEVWTTLKILPPNQSWEPRDFIDILWLFQDHHSHVGIEIAITTAWGIWNNRNNIR